MPDTGLMTARVPLLTPLTIADALAAKRRNEATHVAAVVEQPQTVVAAVGMASLVIGSGSESDEYVPPLITPHLYWDCLTDSPHLDSAIPIHTLIDNSSSLVMISEDLIKQLKLPRVPLHKPLSVGLVVDSGEVGKVELRESVLLCLYSVNLSWALRFVHTVVTPGLCTSIILGQSFLASHSIIIDHTARTVIDKRSGFDLLNPPAPAKTKPPPCYE